MTDQKDPAPRPVSLVAIVAIFCVLSLFWVLAVRYYLPGRPPAPQNEAPDRLSKDLAWRATPASRKQALAELRESQAKQAVSYRWLDQKAGILQIPVERAMELFVKEHGQGDDK